MGYERRYNPALQFNSREAFVAYMNEDQPVRPANIMNIVAINQGKRPLTMLEPQAVSLRPTEVSELMNDGHIVVDTRSEAIFGGGHIPGTYNIQLNSSEFEQRVGWVTPLDVPLLLVVESWEDAQWALHALAFVGLDQRVKGYLAGGMWAWLDEGLPHDTLPQLSVYQLQDQLLGGLEMRVLDVRETSEWDDGHIEQADYMNYKHLRERISALPLNKDEHVSVVCARGLRSSTACSILRMNGYKNVYNVTGGMSAWSSAGLPMIDARGRVIRETQAAKPEWFEL
jgi:rhodanese-related sulfurtransferase